MRAVTAPVVHQAGFDPVELAEMLSTDHLIRGASVQKLLFAEHCNGDTDPVILKIKRMVGKMGRHEHRNTAVSNQSHHGFQYFELVPEIKMHRRLIHNDDGGLLYQGSCYEYQLAFAPAQLGVGPIL